MSQPIHAYAPEVENAIARITNGCAADPLVWPPNAQREGDYR